MTFTAYIEAAWHSARESWRQARTRSARRASALAFNRVETFTRLSRAQWMCPRCNKIHKAIGTSPFTGLQFPACCVFDEGGRLDKGHCTGRRP
jgi:hypothetical protein